MRRLRGLISSEAIALVSAICIVLILLGAHYQRQIDDMDQQALKVAQQVYEILTPPPSAQAAPTDQTSPAAPVAPAQNPGEILAKELKAPAPIEVKVLDNHPQAWKVLVWHPQGVVHYLVTPQGVTQKVR
ncbi:hypothetical protein [Desulfoferula mesophila]|uniref:Uncharacterized protein n=1 Tax=Desulfoferula mesophila TaxID=3058419 RepID=A0AAU9ED27_9BACT|nr:hypothetical protein FAK_21270 [Desulfoferula mesophilus]